jgi:hypothetical protein
MPKFHEIYCETDFTRLSNSLQDCMCPLSNTPCDGGGNRHQTTIKGEHLKLLSNTTLEKIVPAVCSIKYSDDTSWIVCPRRLFAFPNNLNNNKKLQLHELEILRAVDTQSFKYKAVYSEIYLQLKDDDADINYHFDYIITDLHDNITTEKFFQLYEINSVIEQKKFFKIFKANKLINNNLLSNIPKLDGLRILEVMTASTSGSNTSKGTDIKSAFIKALNQEDYECPGINKRQVWGRMATQLFAKSALAESWGSKTYWIVQNELLKNICRTTKLELTHSRESSNTVNFISMGYDNSQTLKIDESFAIPSGISYESTGSGIDILLPKKNPTKLNLLEALLRRKPSIIYQ